MHRQKAPVEISLHIKEEKTGATKKKDQKACQNT
jgi:hypothetical protein